MKREYQAKQTIFTIFIFVRQSYFLFTSDCTERDIFFAIDGSASVGPENFRKQVKFLEQFVQNADLGSRKIRLGVMEFSNSERSEIIFGFDSSQNPRDIQYLLSTMPYYNKQDRHVGEALKKIYNSVSFVMIIDKVPNVCLYPIHSLRSLTCLVTIKFAYSSAMWNKSNQVSKIST